MEYYRGLKLDRFQREAIEFLEKNRSIIVSAPTGSGKTLIADYIIEKICNSGGKVVYTSPIKALTNQKFREFSAVFGNQVGILTGDVSLNRDANLLLMTTEVYRNILFDDGDLVKDIKYVIFDEIHFLGDIERGTVWEEAIIFTPDEVQILALSATISNIKELAYWIGTIRNDQVFTIIEKTRPVPLTYYYVTEKYGLADSSVIAGIPFKERKYLKPLPYLKLLEEIIKTESYPAMMFIFSRKKTKRYASEFVQYLKKNEINLYQCDADRKKALDFFNEKATEYGIDGLASTTELRSFVSRGVAVHNAGLSYQLKVIIEELFTMKLIAFIFTTETFALGINMPAKSVIFDTIDKYDGHTFRILKSREFFQMAGRSGRRGIDSNGYVFIMVDFRYHSPDEILKVTVEDKVEPVVSQFNLSYNSVLNIYHRYPMKIICQILKDSFAQFQLNEKFKSVQNTKSGKPEYCHKLHKSYDVSQKIQEVMEIDKKFESQIQDIKKKFRHIGKNQRQRMIWSHVKKKNRALRKHRCYKCKHFLRCQKDSKDKLAQKRDRSKFLSEFSKDFYFRLFQNKLDILRSNKFFDEDGHTYKGSLASSIHGYEIVISEVISQGLVTGEMDLMEIIGILGCIVFEERKNDHVMHDGPVNKIIVKAVEKINKILKKWNHQESDHGLNPSLEPVQAYIYPVFVKWADGESKFEEILAITNFQEGDLIKLIRKLLDLIFMLLKCESVSSTLRTKLKKSIPLLNRGIINIEEFLGSFAKVSAKKE
ncbi:DEAD/DEAH box helicase [bacterium]|nr:DEAD/DEAH box helicase [bacterium]